MGKLKKQTRLKQIRELYYQGKIPEYLYKCLIYTNG